MFGVTDGSDGPRDLLRIAERTCIGSGSVPCPHSWGPLRCENVDGNVDEGGPSATRGGVSKRIADEVGDAPGLPARAGPLGYRTDHRDLIHLLKRAHPELRERALSTD